MILIALGALFVVLTLLELVHEWRDRRKRIYWIRALHPDYPGSFALHNKQGE